ncbi:MAG: hypothetical protein HC905_04050 [Bacteroidales bacterium]|nr:hypothetical protein [Bacteroidales bacterium]
MLWIAFVIPMLFVNVTFIAQSFSDPFGWGWDFFGTANIPWHQFIPGFVPWVQSIVVLTGLYLSLRNLKRIIWNEMEKSGKHFNLILPMGLFIILAVIVMILFFTKLI